ncbi:MAG: hypothetical protein A2X64_04845 [Ignavibacteria bacterium GWF2_33_9]|nr:MAG: hypothetical protein A2X64_04845 [Ignavibacteria bacterium GWF2_33_9]
MKLFKDWDNKKKANVFIWLMLIITIIAYIVFSPSGIVNRYILTKKNNVLKLKIAKENQINDSLNKQINKILNDTNEIEKIAREKYGMKLPGEKIYIVPSKKKEE